MSPRVSVIIPVYNREAFIGDTVRSVLTQTFRDFELIAVDDGSADGSRQVLEGFGEAITVLEHPGRTNHGQSAAINLGLAAARGEFIAVLDSDDTWEPRKLELLLGFLDANPDIGIAYSNGWQVDENGSRLATLYSASHREENQPGALLLDCYVALPSNSLVRRSAYDAAGNFDETLRTAQDHDMLVRLGEVARLGYLPEKLWSYRRHPRSISKTAHALRWRNGFLIVEKARQRGRIPAGILRRRRAVLHFRLAQLAWEERRLLAAAGRAAMAGLLDPFRAAGVLLGRERAGSPHA